jgi:nicotinamidase-related amidase
MTHLTRQFCRAALFAVTAFAAFPAAAADVTKEWTSVKPPPVPELKPVTIDPRTTGLLVFDFMKGNCGTRPRCVSSVPSVKKLIDEARAHNMMIYYTLVGNDPTPAGMVDQGLAPRPNEHVVKNARGANKFYESDLEQALKSRGTTAVIITGTSAQGAVAGSSQGATERGFKAIVPVDGMSAEDAYNEQYAAWHLAKGGPAALINNVTVTRSDLIKFGN